MTDRSRKLCVRLKRHGRPLMRPGGEQPEVSVHLLSSPLGMLKVAVRQRRLVALAFPAEPIARFQARLARRLPGARIVWDVTPEGEPGALLGELSRQLGLYFARLKSRFFLPLAPPGTVFQQRVWEELQRIPYGSVRSYGEVARTLGGRRYSRAVGSACASNPVPIIIPCHRVVASDGSLGGYSGGPELKRLLLAVEGQTAIKASPAA
jgi:methylated-DNA-[protein]-cysteine S-methyltransferase